MKKKQKNKKKPKKKRPINKRAKKPKKHRTKKRKFLKNKKTKIRKNKKKKFNKLKDNFNSVKSQNNSLVLKLVRLQLSLKPQFNFKINLNLERYIQGFFDKISETISSYKILKHDEKRRLRLEKIENERNEKIAIENKKREEEALKIKLKEQALKEEARLEKQRTKDNSEIALKIEQEIRSHGKENKSNEENEKIDVIEEEIAVD